ncbi:MULTISPECIES: TonB-dependent receptor domain-containing protein [Robiginitalea]|uniref:TonB-dependent receptor domain-containing protein n=1 Tax=Robiginitalea TaxID=252306 RepID=UPI0023499620|nr:MULTISPECIES: TonB-dependent receptor [unclassified Robiginitalea]MDC6354195.1 TonB-dependent receptor [Robiginitalea sp. PM2]MDC6374462.1 TonB-dependent receptor [Robiginitalea sp. SP8]
MRHFLILLFAAISLNLQAQRPQGPGEKSITLTGTVLDQDTGRPLEYATLVLQKVGEPSNVTGGITDIDGKFNVTTEPGRYNIRVEYISYLPYTLDNQLLRQSRDLGEIRMAINAQELDAVEVIGERTTVEVRLDKKIYNIGKDLTNSGATISDALNNVPSVTVDVEGAISLRGNENVRILINGKPSALAGFGSTEALQQLPADAIERVEVITSPSARYDAEGTAGILNIVLRKEKTLGFNGSVNTYIGVPVNSGITANGNIRTDAFNLFSTLGYRYRDAPGNGYFDNSYTSGSFDRIIEDRDINRLNRGLNWNIGMEYFLNDQSSLTGSFFYRLGNDDDQTDNNTTRFVGSEIDSRTLRQELESEDDRSYQWSLNYTNNFNDDGHKLTADVQIGRDREDVATVIEERTTFPQDGLVALENVAQEENSNEYLIQADYVLPMGESQFEAGFRFDLEEEITSFRLDSLDRASGQFVVNELLTNTFTYNEDVYAAYTQYGSKIGKFSFLLGLRLENTRLRGELESEFDPTALEEELGVDVDVNFDKNYLGLFPTVNLIYEIGENENISLGYNRRINRPRGWFINPFPSRDSRTNVFQGNPDLNPAFSNTFDLGYLKRWDKLTFNTSVYYQRETDSFERIQESTGQTTTDGIDIIRSIPINLSTNQRYGGEASILFNPSRKFRINSSFNIFRFVNEGFFNGVDYGAENTSWFARLGSKVTLPAAIEWQTNAFYFGPRQNAITDTKGIFSLNLAFSKDIIEDNGTITLNVNDFFNSRKRRSFTETEFFTSDSEFQWRQRSVTFSFIYRFNEQKKRNAGRGGNGNFDDDGEFEGGSGS